MSACPSGHALFIFLRNIRIQKDIKELVVIL